MAIVLGLLVSLTYGCGDFFGGLATKRARVTAVVIGSFSVSACVLALITLGWGLVGTLPHPAPRDLVLGAATGLVGPVALGLLYRGLAMGRMSVMAPITAVMAAVVPFGWGLASGERPPALALAGVAAALIAVMLIASAPAHPDDTAPVPRDGLHPALGIVPTAIGSGFGFGVVFILLGSTTDSAGLWPLVVSRPLSVTVTVVVVLALARRGGTAPAEHVVAARPAWPFIATSGVLDITANGLFLAATRHGLLSIVSVLSSLYPASTVLLARVVLGERLHRLQIVGLGLATAGVVAMAAA